MSMQHGRRRRRQLVLFMTWLFAAAAMDVTTATESSCTKVPLKTLSLSCGSKCEGASYPCLVFSGTEFSPCNYTEASPRSTCTTSLQAPQDACGYQYQCFTPYDVTKVFKFYVTFNTTKTMKPVYGSDPADASIDGTYDVPYESNDLVRRVASLDLPSTVEEVVIAGGRTGTVALRGSVVNLEFDTDVFSMAPQLTAVSLRNMDLGTHLPDIAAVVPVGVLQLDVSNTNLSQVPVSLGRLAKLQTLTLDRNFITDWPTNLSLPTITQLKLSENQLTSFQASDLPALEVLDLSGNQLASFPYQVLTTSTTLRSLRVNNNPLLKSVAFSSDHFAKLALLTTFAIDSSALDTSSCAASQLHQLPQSANQTVCVVQVAEWDALQRRRQQLTIEPTATSGTSLKTITVGALVGVALLVGVAVFIFKKKTKREGNTKATLMHAESDVLTAGDATTSGRSFYENFTQSPQSSGSNQIYSLRKDPELLALRLRIEDIEDVRVIGSGGFALVWLVNFRPQNRLLASKRLIRDQVTRQRTMTFVNEIKLNMKLVHPSVVQFVGVAWTIETELQALFEYMSNGDLRSHLEGSPVTPWSEQKLKMAIDIIEALVYVHSFSPPLVHRDLKARNVLLNDDMKAKLGDFGVSRFESERGTMTYAVGTGRWLAPEVIAGSRSYDSSCDIYSFGVMMSEIDTHGSPYEDARGPQDNTLPEVAILQMVASGELQPALGDGCPPAICALVTECLAFKPEDRPNAISVASTLHQILSEWKS